MDSKVSGGERNEPFKPCPVCGGEALSLGVWAAYIQLRCRACGIDYRGPEWVSKESCCAHGPAPLGDGGGCPDAEGRFKCVLCGTLMPKGATSAICGQCRRTSARNGFFGDY